MLTDSEIFRQQQLRPHFRLVPPTDWRSLLRTGANALISGPQEALTAFAQAARSEMQEPIRSVANALPLRVDDAGTLILTEVDALDEAQQQWLLWWMNEPQNRTTQILSLTSTSLFSLVGAKKFDITLYYRLNTIFLELS